MGIGDEEGKGLVMDLSHQQVVDCFLYTELMAFNPIFEKYDTRHTPCLLNTQYVFTCREGFLKIPRVYMTSLVATTDKSRLVDHRQVVQSGRTRSDGSFSLFL